jgi:hypothetical protein
LCLQAGHGYEAPVHDHHPVVNQHYAPPIEQQYVPPQPVHQHQPQQQQQHLHQVNSDSKTST